jgi:hypothetical protein
MITQAQKDAQILLNYEKLDAEKIKGFLSIVDQTLENNRKHPYYNLSRSITDSVYKFNSMSFKQFKSLYYFVNSCNKKTVGDTKTF